MSLLQRLKKAEQEMLKEEEVSDGQIGDDVFMPKKGTAGKEDPNVKLKNNIHRQLVAMLGRHGNKGSAVVDEELVRKIPAIVEGIMEKENIQISVGDKRE